MTVVRYRWGAVKEFVNRDVERARLEAWWASPQREPINLYGRRRVGKSWLFRLLYRLARQRKVLVVVDEFPYLLGTTSAEQQVNLSAIQAVMEQERESSKIKLMLTGSTIARMEALQAEKSPLHGRLLPLPLRPLPFQHARLFMPSVDPLEQLTRYAVTGGMPRYLHALAGDDLLDRIATQVADRYGPFFNEPATLLQTELREPSVYFSVLSRLARMPQTASAIAADLRLGSNEVSRYLGVLQSLQLVTRRLPVGARVNWRPGPILARTSTSRSPLSWPTTPRPCSKRRSSTGSAVVMPVGPIRSVGGGVRRCTPSAPARAGSPRKSTRSRCAVARCWPPVRRSGRGKPLGASVLTSLREHKLPAMAQAGFEVADADIVLASRSGFTDGVRALAQQDPKVQLWEAKDILAQETS